MKLKALIIKALLFISPFFVEAKAPELTPNLTLQKSEEILKEHVNFKKISPELVKRIIENFLEELDPTKTYLLDSEVAEWNNPSDLLVSEIVKNYKEARFDQFEKMYDVMLNSISRRGLLEASISDITPPKNTKPSDLQELKWAKDDIELKDRLLKIRSLQLETVKQL